MSRFWLYLGILLVCSGIGTGVGILLVIFYFWDDIKSSIDNLEKDQSITESIKMDYYDDETLDELK
jgi:hypothetical protein